jgi:hypothetical protein
MIVEAALVLPLYLFILLFLIFLVRVSVCQMALEDAASQTVRQTAAHVRPAELFAEQAAPTAAEPSAEQPEPKSSLVNLGPLFKQLAGRLPAPAGPVLEAIGEGDWKPVADMAASKVGGSVVEPLVRQLAEDTILEIDRIRLGHLTLPDLQGGEDAFFELELQYDFPLGLPFTNKYLTLRARAEERVWVSDPLPAAGKDDHNGADKKQKIQIIGIEPVPVRPGRKARLIVKTDPGGAVSLSIEYKSGTSKAKHLGDATAGEDGIVAWEWLVSGNTTPGTWELFVTGADGNREGMFFDVEKGR